MAQHDASERSALHDDIRGECLQRYQRLTPWVGQSIEKLRRAQERPDVETEGHDKPAAVELLCGADINPEPIRWLWENCLARGKLHIVAGAPGAGKTTIAIAFAATITSGGRWPDGTRAELANVLVWSGEDDIADTLIPRFLAMGGDPNRLYFVGGVRVDGKSRPFDPARDMEALARQAEAVGNVGLLIVDPVVQVVTGDSHKNSETRRGLQPVVDLAQRLDAVALGISHFSKGTAGRDPVERVTGSVAFGAMPRVVLGAAKRTDADGTVRRLLVRAKSNIGPDSGGFAYALGQGLVSGHPGLWAARVEWGESLEGQARELLASAEGSNEGDERSGTGEAADLLKELLSAGHMKAKEATGKLKQSGYTDKQIRRARERLGVQTVKQGFGADAFTVWRLPQTCPESSNLPKDAPLSEGASRASLDKFHRDEEVIT